MKFKLQNFICKFWPELLVFIFFVSLSFVFQFFHESWLDEAQAWNIGSTLSFGEIFRMIGYEGTPALWHVCIKILSLLGVNFFGFHIFHWLVIASAVGLLLFFSPFSRWQKILLPFGYFFLFEYNLIARSYALAVLFLFLLAALYHQRFKRPYLFTFLLILLSQTCIHASVVSLVIFVFFVIELTWKNVEQGRKIFSLAIIFLLNFGIIIWQVLPPSDVAKNLPWNTPTDLLLFFNSFIDAFVPISALRENFWGTQILIDFFTQKIFYFPTSTVVSFFLLDWLRYFFGLGLFLISVLFFTKNRWVLLQYVGSILALEFVFYLLNPGSVRHHGLIFIVFIYHWWIAGGFADRKDVGHLVHRNILRFFIFIVLFLHIISGFVAYCYEYHLDFSGEKRVAMFLKKQGFLNGKYQIVGFHANTATGLSAYLSNFGVPVYCLEYGRNCQFNVWNIDYERSLKWKVDDLINKILVLQKNIPDKKIVLASYKKIDNEKFNKYFQLIYSVDQVIMSDGKVYIYVLQK